MISFACFSPHPPLLLPTVGSKEDRARVKKTITSLEQLGKKLKETNPEQIIISSPHPNWGFDVPLHFIAPNFKGEIDRRLVGIEPPKFSFEEGKRTYQQLEKGKKYALIASGDLSHRLKEDGPYGFHPDGPKFDQRLIKLLEDKDIENFLKLDEMFPQAGECGLRSFSFLLGILEEWQSSKAEQKPRLAWQPKIISYEGPFGVGYLTANFRLFQ